MFRHTQTPKTFVTLVLIAAIVFQATFPAITQAEDRKCGEEIAGEYILEYSSDNQVNGAALSAQVLEARVSMESRLGTVQARTFSDISPNVRFIRSHKERADVVSGLERLKETGIIARYSPNRVVCTEQATPPNYSVSGRVRVQNDAREVRFAGSRYRVAIRTLEGSQSVALDNLGSESFGCSNNSSYSKAEFTNDITLQRTGSPAVAAVRRLCYSCVIAGMGFSGCDPDYQFAISGQGTGYFPDFDESQTVELGELPGGGILHDINLDGHVDVVGWKRVYTNVFEQSGVFTMVNNPLGSADTYGEILTPSDTNGDGYPELLYYLEKWTQGILTPQLATVTTQQGTNFQSVDVVTLPATDSLSDYAIGDINGDNIADIVLGYTNLNGGCYGLLLLGSTSGTYSQSLAFNLANFCASLGGYPDMQMITADLNQDGKDDLIIVFGNNGASSGNGIVIFPGTHSGFGQGVAITSIGSSARRAIVADIDDDGDLDILLPLKSDEQNYYLKNLFTEQNNPNIGFTQLVEPTLLPAPFPETSTLKFTTFNPSGAFDVEVLLTRLSDGLVVKGRTDQHGEFKIGKVPPGQYSASINHPSIKVVTPPAQFTVNGNVREINFEVERTPAVSSASPAPAPNNYPNDPGMPGLWGLYNFGQENGTAGVDINVLSAWDVTQGDPNLIVGVLDTGIDITHHDFIGNIWVNSGETPNNSIDDDGNGYIDDTYGFSSFGPTPWDPINGHGTHVAGTIAAVRANETGISGVAPKVKVMAIKVLEDSGSGSLTAILDGLNYAIKMRELGHNLRVLNLSLGGGDGPCPAGFLPAVEKLSGLGVVVVFAAGNDSKNADLVPQSIASCVSNNTLVVAAIDRNGALTDFSNYGKTTIDLAAPGKDILSLTPFQSYDYYPGTSMAAPHVAGIAALLLSKEPNLTAPQAKARIIAGVKPLAALADHLIYPGIPDAGLVLKTPPGSLPGDAPGNSPQQPNDPNASAPPGVPPTIKGVKPVKITRNKNTVTVNVLVSVVAGDDPVSSVKATLQLATGGKQSIRTLKKQKAKKKTKKGKAIKKQVKNEIFTGVIKIKLPANTKKNKSSKLKKKSKFTLKVVATDQLGRVGEFTRNISVK